VNSQVKSVSLNSGNVPAKKLKIGIEILKHNLNETKKRQMRSWLVGNFVFRKKNLVCKKRKLGFMSWRDK
jgi:hypothetical protein